MFDSIYIGLTGLTTFSDGLKTISNNVANMNTPGYKARQMLFSDLFYQAQVGSGQSNTSSFANGSGVGNGGEYLNPKQGELRSTGNDLDVALDGNGFFVLRDGNDQEVYTRAGQFEVASDGSLVARDSGNKVLFLNSGGGLQQVNVNDHLTNPAKATSLVSFSDSLSVNDATFSVNASVFDSLGGSHTLVVKFTNNSAVTAGSWLVEVSENGNVLNNGEVRFQGSGAPVAGFEKISFTYQPSTQVTATALTLDLSKATAFSAATSTLKIASQDGFGQGSLTKTTFNTDGTLVFSYSNGQKTNGPRLALAHFGYEAGLDAIGDNLFLNSSGQTRLLGSPNESVFGKLTGGSIESSNVDLAGQFSELIVTQRGYQASSQVISAANEMIQQLFEMQGKR